VIAWHAQHGRFLGTPLLLESETPRRELGCQHHAGLSLPQPRRLPHPAVHAEVLAPAQAASVPLAPAPSGALAHSSSQQCGQQQGLAHLGAAHPSTDLAWSFPRQLQTQATTSRRAPCRWRGWRSLAACVYASSSLLECTEALSRLIFLMSTNCIKDS